MMLPLQSEDEFEDITTRFAQSGALALMLVEILPLEKIERSYGVDAYESALRKLLTLVGDLARASVSERDVLVTSSRSGETLMVFLFRPRGDREFYTAGFPVLRDRLADELVHQGRNAVYPYHREPLAISIGGAISLFNPNVKPAHQILRAVNSARRDAELEAGLRARERGDQILRLILAETIATRYEPIVALDTGEAIGFEALTRGPEGSSLYLPDRLFAHAAEIGLVFEVDCLCRRVAFENSGCLPGGKKLFLNCLPASIGDPNLRGEGLLATLEKYQLAPSDLVLEISERESIENFAIFRELRDIYRELGVQIAVDDAGAGYASLEAIMEISPDYMKADMTLVRGIDTDPPRREVLTGLASVAERIGADVIAEGIETEEELAVVRELGIRYGQGYIFGPPLTPQSGDAEPENESAPPSK
jgi:EAL domain-containing protein (putative c-di-GMP-specific phosphodiesterase class I)